ncbi:MAG: ankyrin repeat domain-containing protein [Deltaproteobacteria bacterium]|nr:ankyrin repeat domain-containing protein [Deltaproteobacteria bacterium]
MFIKKKRSPHPFGLIFILTSALIFTACSSPFHDAALRGDLGTVKRMLLKGERISKRDINGDTVLHIAAREGNIRLVELLLGLGAGLDQHNSYQRTPLSVAASHGKLDMAKYLLKLGADMEAQDFQGNTPVMLAAAENHAEVVRYLVRQGARFYHVNFYKETAYKLATQNGHTDLAKYLVGLSGSQNPPDTDTEPETETPDDHIPPRLVITSPRQRGIELSEAGKTILIAGTASDESGQVRVFVMGQAVYLDERGNFELMQSLETGTNEIEIYALDRAGNKSHEKLTVRSSFVKAKPDRLNRGKSYALIIGSNNYQRLPKLETPINDATVIDRLLTLQYGFQSEMILDADKEAISRALNRYRSVLRPEDSFLLYYAGHGVFDKNVNKAYWLPVDAEKKDDTNWLITDAITAKIQRLPAKHVLVVSDSCYSGTLTRSVSLDENGSDRLNYLKALQDRHSRTLMASGGNEPVSDSSKGGAHSVFAEAFIKSLSQNQDEMLSAEKLFYQGVKEYVAGNSEQVPEYSIIRNSGHQGGDFIFYRSKKP